MIKNTISHLFFLNLFFTYNIHGMQNTSSEIDYNKNIYFPVVQLTHNINHCFHDAFLFLETPEKLLLAKHEIVNCCDYIKQLCDVIAIVFDTFQQENIKNIFECIAEQGSKKEKEIITTQVLNELEWPHSTHTNALGNSIAGSLTAIHNQLRDLNVIDAPDKYGEELCSIHQAYQSLLAYFDPQNNHQEIYIPNPITNFFITPQQERVNLLSKKEYLEYKIQQNPYLETSYLHTISTRAKKLSWVPFLDTSYVIKQIIVRNAGEEAYKQLTKTGYFKIFQLLHDYNLISLRTLFTEVHKLLETSLAKYIIRKQEGQLFADHSRDLQEYFFIELLETLHKAHHNSLKMINKEKRFSFVLKQKAKVNVTVHNPAPAQNINTPTIWTVHNARNSLGAIPGIIASTDFNAIKTTAINTATLFFSSMMPWYTPPTNPINPINPAPVIQPTANTIKDFLLKVNSIDPHYIDTYDIGIHRQFPYLPKAHAFCKMVDKHTELTRNLKMQYGLHKARDKTKTLPGEWDTLTPKIDELYATLNKLTEERKQLWFFNIWAKRTNSVKRNHTEKLLQKHINAYNMVKADLYTEDPSYATQYPPQIQNMSMEPVIQSDYTKSRKNFLKTCTFSSQDNIDIFKKTTRNGSPLKQYLNVLSPLEQTELRYAQLHGDI